MEYLSKLVGEWYRCFHRACFQWWNSPWWMAPMGNPIDHGPLKLWGTVGMLTRLLAAPVPSGKHTKNYGKSPFLMGKSTISMAIFNSYVKLPEGNLGKSAPIPLAFHNGLILGFRGLDLWSACEHVPWNWYWLCSRGLDTAGLKQSDMDTCGH